MDKHGNYYQNGSKDKLYKHTLIVMDCRIEWNSLSLQEWEDYYAQIRRAPLLQSYNYAIASFPFKGQQPKWGLIYIDNKKAGIVQLAYTALPLKIFEIIILDMGPLWFDNNNLKKKNRIFFKEFARQYPCSVRRKRRIIPYLEDSNHYTNIPQSEYYKNKSADGYETIWLDLEQELPVIRQKLKQKWRNQLNKSEKQNLSFKVDEAGNTLRDFRNEYQKEILNKKYRNIAPQHLPSYLKSFSNNNGMILFYMTDKKEILSSALVLIHGSAATYQIGILTNKGREACANHALLWNIIEYLKSRGIKDFDLGGINAYDAKGIQHFKEGLGGDKVSYKGIYS